jgi:lysophospholipase L1-like esterase
MQRTVVACLGDSITAGSPLWDPDPAVRARTVRPDERSQWMWWTAQREPSCDFRNHGVYGERTDQIAKRFDAAVDGAHVLVVQGGINDVVQGRAVEDAAHDLDAMCERGRALGLRVLVADVLPWNNGDARAAADIVRLNELIHLLDAEQLAFNATLGPERMRDEWTDDGDHPSVEGHRLLGALYAAVSS